MPNPSYTHHDQREEVELLKDMQTAIAQVEAKLGILKKKRAEKPA